MQPVPDRVRPHPLDLRYGKVYDAPIRRVERFEADFATGCAHLFCKRGGFVDQMRFAPHSILTHVHDDVPIWTELA